MLVYLLECIFSDIIKRQIMEGSLFFMEGLNAHKHLQILRGCLVLGVVLSGGGKGADEMICGPVWRHVCSGLVCNLKTYFPIASSRYGSVICEDQN